ncbi:hypothetical protein L1887_42332 [Cichorium endivia]|nr:hypothetical protein L1887_42332 [Cichorium endivia]
MASGSLKRRDISFSVPPTDITRGPVTAEASSPRVRLKRVRRTSMGPPASPHTSTRVEGTEAVQSMPCASVAKKESFLTRRGLEYRIGARDKSERDAGDFEAGELLDFGGFGHLDGLDKRLVVKRLSSLVHKRAGEEPVDFGIGHLVAHLAEPEPEFVRIDLADVLLVKALEGLHEHGLVVELCEMLAEHGEELGEVDACVGVGFKVRLECGWRCVHAEVSEHGGDVALGDETVRIGVDHVERLLEALDLLGRKGGVERRGRLAWVVADLAGRGG